LNKINRYQAAVAIAILFHAIGLIGILFFDSKLIAATTPVNLALMFVLLLWTQKEKNGYFFLFAAVTIGVGFFVEVIGVNTGVLFGEYTYGPVLGYKFQHVPLNIGINWFIIIYCCGISVHTLLMKAINRISFETQTPPMALKAMSVIIDGATLAVLFDWIMEPIAVKLNFWHWSEETIPFYNYICWFVISNILLAVFHFCKFNKQNKFAIDLLLIQVMFFMLLRAFMK
jgi:bisanhydrobacterioruberin hydratase